jgi:hypothetical protein
LGARTGLLVYAAGWPGVEVDWLAFAVWEDARPVRSLSLSPDDGIVENIGDPLPFGLPCWAGDRPADVLPRPDEEEPYALPCHPLDLGEDAPRVPCGFAREGRTEPGDVDADAIELHGSRVRDANGPGPAGREAEPGQAVGAVGPPRVRARGPGGALTERDSL